MIGHWPLPLPQSRCLSFPDAWQDCLSIMEGCLHKHHSCPSRVLQSLLETPLFPAPEITILQILPSREPGVQASIPFGIPRFPLRKGPYRAWGPVGTRPAHNICLAEPTETPPPRPPGHRASAWHKLNLCKRTKCLGTAKPTSCFLLVGFMGLGTREANHTCRLNLSPLSPCPLLGRQGRERCQVGSITVWKTVWQQAVSNI